MRLFRPVWGRSEDWEEGMEEMGQKDRDGRRKGPYLPVQGTRRLSAHDLAATTACDMVSTTIVRAFPFDTSLHPAVSQHHLSSPKGTIEIFQRQRQHALFRRTYHGMGTGVSRLGFQGFFSQQNIPTWAYKEQSAFKRWNDGRGTAKLD